MKNFLFIVMLLTAMATQTFAIDRYTEDFIDSLKVENNIKQRYLDSIAKVDLQNSYWSNRAKFCHFSYAMQHLKNDCTGMDLKSDVAAAFSAGRTCYVNDKAWGNVVKFGIDVTFFDLNWAKYTLEENFDEWSGEGYGDGLTIHQIEVGVGAGLSVTARCVQDFKVQAYCRYLPYCSVLLSCPDYDDTQADVFWAGYINPGISFSWRLATIGMEWRLSGKPTYDGDAGYLLNENYCRKAGIDFEDADNSYDFNSNSMRIYIGFRF